MRASGNAPKDVKCKSQLGTGKFLDLFLVFKIRMEFLGVRRIPVKYFPGFRLILK